MGRPKKAIAPNAPARELAEFLRELRERSSKTYEQMKADGGPSVSTLSRADAGEVPTWSVVSAYVAACGAGAAELRAAERLWRRGSAREAAGPSAGDAACWREPDAVTEPRHLGEVMRAAREACGSPSYRVLEEQAELLGLALCRSTLWDALRLEAVPGLRVFCDYMRVIADFPGSPAAGYRADVWAQAWQRAQGRRRRRLGELPAAAEMAEAGRVPGGEEVSAAGRRRPRLVAVPWTPPGSLRDLKEALHELYLSAGAPSLADIAGTVRREESLRAAPKRDSIHRVLRSPQLPANPDDVEAVAVSLASMAGHDQEEVSARVRTLWVAAAGEPPFGHAIGDLSDPLALGVHPTFEIADDPVPLPEVAPYVERGHDQHLADVLRRVVAGRSQIVVARGDGETGKTRSCWEAVRTLPVGWRLWYPADPSDARGVLDALAAAGPGCVVWLDEIDRYLDAEQEELAQDVQGAIRRALSDRRRAPVLVIGTVSSGAALLERPMRGADGVHASARKLVEKASFNVPTVFTAEEQDALRELAGRDPRLAMAQAQSRGGVAQYLTNNRANPVRRKTHTFRVAVAEGDTDTLLVGAAVLEASGRSTEAATWYQAAAEAGDTQAFQPAAALLSENGSLSDAISWLRERADTGDASAALEAGHRLRQDGRDEEAITLYQRAARIGSTGQALKSAAALLRRSGRTEEALAWLKECAEAGDTKAMREAANLLWGTGDRDGSLRYYEMAAEAGDTGALLEAADHLHTANETVLAIDWYRRAVAEGNDGGLHPLADLLRAEGDHDGALSYYQLAADRLCDMVAMRHAAALYRLENAPDKALIWYKKAANAGDQSSLLHIAALHQSARDIDTALGWYTKAADCRQRDAHREAVWMLWDEGRLEDAFAWLRRRVKNGDRRAVREMADLMHETGSLTDALAWYRRAAEQGSVYAADRAARLEAHLAAKSGGGGS